ncbi:Haao [Symbiodinium necroappetens]|uniref:Haao protein n=1 Tax=Symbiodinium necroappetens TaxID=1628268 RepID=A0A812Y8X4_9DINO|nr:Haao [Symbiodinium necroappetens]
MESQDDSDRLWESRRPRLHLSSLGVRYHRTVVVRLTLSVEKSRLEFPFGGDAGEFQDAETDRCFFLVQYLLDIGGIAWENLIHAGCNDIPANLASSAAHPFACGVERVVWMAFLVMATLVEGYFLFILQSYCQDVVVHLPTKAFGDLYEKSEAHILKKHLNPYNHLYGALPGQGELAGEAVMAARSSDPSGEDTC